MLIYWRLINYLGLFKVIWLIFPMVNPLLGETMKGTWFISPFVRWGLLDFMSACLPPSSSLLLPPPSSSFLLLPPPGLNCSVPRRTRTATSGSKCSPLDLNHKESPKIECQMHMPERMSSDMAYIRLLSCRCRLATTNNCLWHVAMKWAGELAGHLSDKHFASYKTTINNAVSLAMGLVAYQGLY